MSDDTSGFVVAVVDDDERVLRSLEYLLESADYSVLLFTSADAFVESGAMAKVDCLISDVDMPSVDGFALLRLVQAGRPGLATIVITGYPDTRARLPSFDENNPRFFTKPFHGPELLAAVTAAVAKSPR